MTTAGAFFYVARAGPETRGSYFAGRRIKRVRMPFQYFQKKDFL